MKKKFVGIVTTMILGACATTTTTPAYTSKTFNDVVFDVEGCVISSDRKGVCSLVVTSRFRDRTVAVGNGVLLQDNSGENYPAGVRFGKDKWSKTLIADTPYKLNFEVENMSTKATSMRAIIINRIDIGLGPRQHVGSHSQVIFSKPKMKSKISVEKLATVDKKLSDTSSEKQASPIVDKWVTVGYWNYDGVDGQYLSEGVTLVNQPGGHAGKQWQAHLQLKAHDRLPKRYRTLWPVSLNISQRKVCVAVPGYPTYSASVDLPGSENDGVYLFHSCP